MDDFCTAALTNSSPRQPRSEADRLGKIRGKRAEELLEALKPKARLSDCVGRADGNAGVDWTYLVLELIENGIAAVFTDNGKPVRTVQFAIWECVAVTIAAAVTYSYPPPMPRAHF